MKVKSLRTVLDKLGLFEAEGRDYLVTMVYVIPQSIPVGSSLQFHGYERVNNKNALKKRWSLAELKVETDPQWAKAA